MADRHLIPFQFETHSLSVLTDDNGDPWLIASEVCAVLGIKNVSDACERLDPDEKNTIAIDDGNRGNPTTLIISKAGCYRLAMRSRKPAAKKFQRWILYDVIPQIEKTGSYSVHQSVPTPAEAAVAIAQAVLAVEKRVDVLETQMHALQSERPPVDRNSCTEWLKGTGKPFLAHTLFENFKSACRRREPGIPFRPANLQHALPYYKIETLEAAYTEVTRQLSFLPVSRRKRS